VRAGVPLDSGSGADTSRSKHVQHCHGTGEYGDPISVLADLVEDRTDVKNGGC
jgi:hypothetical protein